MSMYYNLDSIKTELNKEIKRTAAFIGAWRSVTFPCKKDGSPFKNMQQNINGAKYFKPNHVLQDCEKHIRVVCFCEVCGYIDDEINAYELVRYLESPEMIAKKQNYQPKEMYLEQVYLYDIDDIKNAITNHIAQLERRLDALNTQITNADQAFKSFRDAYAAAYKQLEHDTDKSSNSTLFYAILDTVKNRYPYC